MPRKATIEQVIFPEIFQPFLKPNRYKIAYGGRGGAKSTSIACALLLLGTQKQERILCAREYQSSIHDSVHQLLCDQVVRLKLQDFYQIERDTITGINGTTFRFQGLKTNISQVKSFEGITICWVEEAANVSNRSWEILIPTIRKDRSEIWVSFNPEFETDSTYQRFVVNPPPGAVVIKMNWSHNPWFPKELKEEMEHLKLVDPAAYHHVYEGFCKVNVEGAVYAEQIKEMESRSPTPGITHVPYDPNAGVQAFWDLGHADATAIVIAQRCGFETHVIHYIENQQKPLDYYLAKLSYLPFAVDKHFLPHDAKAKTLGTGKSIEEMMRAKGKIVQIVPSLKIEDGINAVRSLCPSMYIDIARCDDLVRCFRNYRYETEKGRDRKETGGLGRAPVHDKFSHGMDAVRYMAIALRPPKGGDADLATKYLAQPFVSGQNGWMQL